MGETKRVVIEHYPVDRLPEELRRGLESGQMVRVTVEADPAPGEAGRLPPLSELAGCAKGIYAERGLDPVDYIRTLRDEWVG